MSPEPTQAFIVMEHFAGGTVDDRLKSGDPIPVPLALRWLREAASALDAAHAADIVHRDVKPGNLLLDENGRLAVGDFGIASIAGETAMTAAGQILGTAAYLSPEQARGRPATPASDRYSLAVVAFELLCGRRPFDGDTPMAQARARVEQEPAAPTGPCAAAGDVLAWGLAREAADRPATAAAFVTALEDALGDAAQPTRATTVMPRRVAATAPAEQPRFEREPDVIANRDPTPTRREPPPDPVARQRSPHYRAFLLAGLTVVCLVVGAAAALISDDGNNNGGRDVTAPRAVSSKPQGSASSQQSSGTSSSSTTSSETPAPAGGTGASSSTRDTRAPEAAPDDGRSAAAINNAGYAMLPGDPQERCRCWRAPSRSSVPRATRAASTTRSRSTTTAGRCASRAVRPRRSHCCRSVCRSPSTSAGSCARSSRRHSRQRRAKRFVARASAAPSAGVRVLAAWSVGIEGVKASGAPRRSLVIRQRPGDAGTSR